MCDSDCDCVMLIWASLIMSQLDEECRVFSKSLDRNESHDQSCSHLLAMTSWNFVGRLTLMIRDVWSAVNDCQCFTFL